VIDTSGSMADPVGGGKLADYLKGAVHLKTTPIKSRLDLAGAEVIFAVSHMREKSVVAVISFSKAENWVTKKKEYEPVTPELRGKIAERVGTLASGKSTNMYAGVHAAFFPDGEPRPQDLFEGP